jgi:hypothetical protein
MTVEVAHKVSAAHLSRRPVSRFASRPFAKCSPTPSQLPASTPSASGTSVTRCAPGCSSHSATTARAM